MKIKKILTPLILALGLIVTFSCLNNNNQKEVDEHTSINSLDWYGVYKGLTPCADCEGIEVKITLKRDTTFSRVLKYLGKEENIFVDEGSFIWDSTGSIITLMAESDRPMYRVGENVLFQLDSEGNQVRGELAPMYTIHKNRSDYSLEDKKWILTELNGNSIKNSSEERTAFIIFNMETGRFSGSNSCNRFFGEYEILEGNKIKLGPAGATLMACPDAQNEQAFMDMLRLVDNFRVADGVLSLCRAKRPPLARFKLDIEE